MKSPEAPGTAAFFNGLNIVVNPSSCLSLRGDLELSQKIHLLTGLTLRQK